MNAHKDKCAELSFSQHSPLERVYKLPFAIRVDGLYTGVASGLIEQLGDEEGFRAEFAGTDSLRIMLLRTPDAIGSEKHRLEVYGRADQHIRAACVKAAEHEAALKVCIAQDLI